MDGRTKQSKAIGALLAHRATWAAVAAITVFHALFAWWFRPSLPMHGLALVLDLAGLSAWAVLAFSSPALRGRLATMPYERQAEGLRRTLAGCAAEFREMALECAALVERISAEFKEDSQLELGLVLANLSTLAVSNRELVERARAFGTEEQKARMRRLMDRQLDSVRGALKSLQAFSGNLTLLEARADRSTVDTDQLKYVNEGLQEVLQELSDER